MKNIRANGRGATVETCSDNVPGKGPANGTLQVAEHWKLRLYMAGHTAKLQAAFTNLQSICEDRLAGKYWIEVIDLLKKPQFAKVDQIVAVPTLVRRLPEPMRKIIGHLSDMEKMLVGFQLRLRGREDE